MKALLVSLIALAVLAALIISVKIAILLMVGGVIFIGCIAVGSGLAVHHINTTCTDDNSPLENAIWGREDASR